MLLKLFITTSSGVLRSQDQITTEKAVMEQVNRNLIFCIPLLRTISDLIELRNNIHTIRIYAGM